MECLFREGQEADLDLFRFQGCCRIQGLELEYLSQLSVFVFFTGPWVSAEDFIFFGGRVICKSGLVKTCSLSVFTFFTGPWVSESSELASENAQFKMRLRNANAHCAYAQSCVDAFCKMRLRTHMRMRQRTHIRTRMRMRQLTRMRMRQLTRMRMRQRTHMRMLQRMRKRMRKRMRQRTRMRMRIGICVRVCVRMRSRIRIRLCALLVRARKLAIDRFCVLSSFLYRRPRIEKCQTQNILYGIELRLEQLEYFV